MHTCVYPSLVAALKGLPPAGGLLVIGNAVGVGVPTVVPSVVYPAARDRAAVGAGGGAVEVDFPDLVVRSASAHSREVGDLGPVDRERQGVVPLLGLDREVERVVSRHDINGDFQGGVLVVISTA